MEIMAKIPIALETGSARDAVGLPFLQIPRTAADWAAAIRKFSEHEKDSVLDLARTVYRAKTSLYRGQWSELFKNRSHLSPNVKPRFSWSSGVSSEN